MTQDRSYWRDQDDARLIDEAKHYPSAELCIALGERLDDTHEADRWCEELNAATCSKPRSSSCARRSRRLRIK